MESIPKILGGSFPRVRVWVNDKDQLHRLDGPSTEVEHAPGEWSPYGLYPWRINDCAAENFADFQKLAGLSNGDTLVLILKYGSIKKYNPNTK